MQAVLRGAVKSDDSMALAELQAFSRGNEKMLFPRVLFETKNTTKEVPPIYSQRVIGR